MGGPGLWREPCSAGQPPHTGAFADWLRTTRGWRLEVVRHPERQLWRYGLDEKPTPGIRVLPRWTSRASPPGTVPRDLLASLSEAEQHYV